MAKAGKPKQATSYTEEVAAGSSMSRRVGVALAVVSGAVLVTAVVLRATELQRENADLRKENVELSKEQSAMDIRLETIEKQLVSSKGLLSEKEAEGVAQKAEMAEVRKNLDAKEKEAKNLQETLDEAKEQVLQQESVNSLVTEENEKQTKVIEENQRKIAEMEALVVSKERAHAKSLEMATKERERAMEEVMKENEEKVSEITKELDATAKSLQLVKSLKEQTEAELTSLSGDLVETEQRCKSEADSSQEKLTDVIANSARERAELVENAKMEKEGVIREKDHEIANIHKVVSERETELENVRRQVSERIGEISELKQEKEEMLVKMEQLQSQLDTNSKDLTAALQQKDETLTELDSKTKDLNVVLKEKEELTIQLGAAGDALSQEKKENEERAKSLEAAKTKAEEETRAAQGDVGNCLVERSKEVKAAMEERSRVLSECQESSRREGEEREREAAQRLEAVLLEKETTVKELEAANGRLASCKTES